MEFSNADGGLEVIHGVVLEEDDYIRRSQMVVVVCAAERL